jgi:hypothetical protein
MQVRPCQRQHFVRVFQGSQTEMHEGLRLSECLRRRSYRATWQLPRGSVATASSFSRSRELERQREGVPSRSSSGASLLQGVQRCSIPRTNPLPIIGTGAPARSIRARSPVGFSAGGGEVFLRASFQDRRSDSSSAGYVPCSFGSGARIMPNARSGRRLSSLGYHPR